MEGNNVNRVHREARQIQNFRLCTTERFFGDRQKQGQKESIGRFFSGGAISEWNTLRPKLLIHEILTYLNLNI